MRTFSTVTFATPPDISLPIEIPALHTERVDSVSLIDKRSAIHTIVVIY
jgi:hypothetical protein